MQGLIIDLPQQSGACWKNGDGFRPLHRARRNVSTSGPNDEETSAVTPIRRYDKGQAG